MAQKAGAVAIEVAARTAKFDSGMGKARGSLKKFQRAANDNRNSVDKLGKSFATLTTRFLGPAAAIAALTLGFKALVKAGEDMQRQQGTIAALLQSTGSAAGVTAAQIEDLAQAIAANSLESIGGVREAAAALLTFKNVAGDAFGRTLTVASDLAAVLGTDLRSATLQLGKALEDPERNLSQLNRSGISFNLTQIAMIKGMKQAGDNAGALAAILGVLEGQLGGAAAGQAGGLAGAFDDVSQSISNMLERQGKTSGFFAFLTAGVNAFTEALEANNRANTADAAIDRQQALVNALQKDVSGAKKPRQFSFLEAVDSPIEFAKSLGQRFVQDTTSTFLKEQEARLQDLIDAYEDLSVGRAIDDQVAKAGIVTMQKTREADLKVIETKKLLKEETKKIDAAIKEFNKSVAEELRLEEKALDQKKQFQETLELELQRARDLLDTSMMGNQEREVELRVRRDIIDAQSRGIKLTEQEVVARRKVHEEIVRNSEQTQDARDAIDDWGQAGRDAAQGFGDSLIDMALEGKKSEDVLQDLIKAIIRFGLQKLLIDQLADSFEALGQVMGGSGGGGIGGIFSSLVSGLIGGFNFGGLGKGVSPTGTDIAGTPFAHGGRPAVGEVALVGEHGPELFVPQTAGQIIPNSQLGSSGGNTYIIDARDTNEQAVARIETALIALAGPGVVERRSIDAVVSEHNRVGRRLFA